MGELHGDQRRGPGGWELCDEFKAPDATRPSTVASRCILCVYMFLGVCVRERMRKSERESVCVEV